MSDASVEFESLLEVFQAECHELVRYTYTLQSLYIGSVEVTSVTAAMNRNSLFWNTTLNALLTTLVVTLGRLFDPEARNYPVSRLLTHCTKHVDLFSREAFEQRQQAKSFGYSPSQIQNRVASAYVPTISDFQILKRDVEQLREFYKAEVRPLRHQFFAHRAVACESEIVGATLSIDPQRLRNCVLYLQSLGEQLYSLYHDGSRPAPSVINVSTLVLLARPDPSPSSPLQEWVVHDVRNMLRDLVRIPSLGSELQGSNPGHQPDGNPSGVRA